MQHSLSMYTVNNLCKAIDNKKIVFDNHVQRNFVWDNIRKSLLIASIVEDYYVPVLVCSEKPDGILDCIDGQQRSLSIYQFVNDRLKLSGLGLVKIDGKEMNINKLKFSDLPDTIQQKILDKQLDVVLLKELTQEQIREYFKRLNNGKLLTATELNRIKAASAENIMQLGQHDVFLDYLSRSELLRYVNENLVMRSWGILFVEGVSFQVAEFRGILENKRFTSEEIETLNNIFDFIKQVFDNIIEIGRKTSSVKLMRSIIKMAMKPTHFFVLVYISNIAIKEGIKESVITDWAIHFFENGKTTSDSEYNRMTRAGVTKASNIRTRLEIILKNYVSFINRLGGEKVV